MLAVIRRGPFAKPTNMEQIEYLFTRVPKTDSRKHFEKHSLEHVLSFQRRVHASKRFFLKRGKVTPLGILEDIGANFTWIIIVVNTTCVKAGLLGQNRSVNIWGGAIGCSDIDLFVDLSFLDGLRRALKTNIFARVRTRRPPPQRQQRGSLHAHILCWFKRKRRPSNWEPIPPLEAKREGAAPKQRPLTDSVTKLEDYQEDSVYQLSEVARVSAEMPRPDVSSESVKWGGFDWDTLRIAGLARAVLIKLNYLHVCSPAYCLLNRATCRFFFPWPQRPYQVAQGGCSSYLPGLRNKS